MNFQYLRIGAVVGAMAISACGGNPQNSSMQATHAALARADRQPENIPHGQEIESGRTIVVSEGNYHAAFGRGATYTRTPNGLVVTFNGVTRTFSSTARIDDGTYHRYAKASGQ